MDTAQKRGELIALLESALALAEEINDGTTSYLVERALDEARAQQFKLLRGVKLLPANRKHQDELAASFCVWLPSPLPLES
jgi:hypothetical protein